MNQLTHLPTRVVPLLAALTAALTSSAAWSFDSGSTGADGVLNPAVNTEVVVPPSGMLNYTTVNIPVGVTVTFKKNTGNTPVHVLASGDVTIAGTLDVGGAHASATGVYGDGLLGDDGLPGSGGPGGFDGGRGGRADAAQRVEIVGAGAGLGPGGGRAGFKGPNNCNGLGDPYYKDAGVGGAHASDVYAPGATNWCTGQPVAVKGYGSELLQPLLGGSGGGGGAGGTTYAGSGGGGGGGAILLASSGTIQVTGTINARGGDGGGIGGPGVGGQGAGGAGGAIRLVANAISGNGKLYAEGGCISLSNYPRMHCGVGGSTSQRGGSDGRIRLEADSITYSGASQPLYSIGTPGPVFIADAPLLRIASVAGQAVPPNPTGLADVTLPATTVDPVVVGFETVNVPVGSTVVLRVVPAYGIPVEAVSAAIAGTTAAGTAQVTVTLPQGPSTLQAATTYTVVVAAGQDLSQFARNEQVEKVEVTVALDGPATARLITVSGSSYEVPYQALRAAGFQG